MTTPRRLDGGYPVTLDLAGRRTLVVGGGPVAARRARGLLAADALVDVVAPQLQAELLTLVRGGEIRWLQGEFEVSHLVEPVPAWFVHTATGVGDVDAAVARACKERGVWCVRADDGGASAAWTPAVARGLRDTAAEGVTVAVTGGGDPRRAVAVRDAISAAMASGSLPVRRVRLPITGAGAGASGGVDAGTAAAVAEGTTGRAARVGRVWLVGGGPGDPGLITVRGREVLERADVVVADRLGPRQLLDDLDPGVDVIDVGKTPGHHPISQERINEILVEQALLGRDVVRLKGGDPFVLGRGGEEALHCVAHGVPVEVVPGVTAAVSVPAAAGIPVTHRGITASFVVASAHDGATAALDALRDAPVTSTLVLLMGVTTLRSTAARLVAAGRSPQTPVALIESGWTDDQRTTVTTLEKAADVAEQEHVGSPAVIVVGDVVSVRAELGDLRGVDAVGAGSAVAASAPVAPSLVLLAHGSPDPRHAEGVERVAGHVRRAWAGAVRTAYLDHHPPTPAEVAEGLSGGVVVPLLLTTAHHVRVDVPAAAASMDAVGRGGYVVAGALGPDELLFRSCEDLLGAAGFAPDPTSAVVLFAGGSSDREAIAAIGAAAQGRTGRGWGPWTVAALAGGDSVATVAARLRAVEGVERVLVVSYMIADGVLRDRMVDQVAEAGATMVPGTLGDTPSLAALVTRRAAAALAASRPRQ